MTYDYTSPNDMIDLARAVRNFENATNPAFYASIIAARLIIHDNIALRSRVWVAHKLRGMPLAQAWHLALMAREKKAPGSLARDAERLCDHIINGKNRADRKCAGALNHAGVYALLYLMRGYGWEPLKEDVRLTPDECVSSSVAVP